MKMVRCFLRMHRSRKDGKDAFPISSMVQGWKIPEAENESVVRGMRICDNVVISARARLKRP